MHGSNLRAIFPFATGCLMMQNPSFQKLSDTSRQLAACLFVCAHFDDRCRSNLHPDKTERHRNSNAKVVCIFSLNGIRGPWDMDMIFEIIYKSKS